MFTELAQGDRREADLVVKARLRGEEAFFIIHLEHEAQSRRMEAFPFRMFTYYSILIQRHRVPVYPIAVLSYSSPLKPAPSSYRITFPDFEPLCFQFRTIQLNRLEWRDFVRRENPVAAALMSRMHIKREERPSVKTACLRLLGKLNLDKARSMLVSHFVDHYLRLDPAEKIRFHEEVDSLPPEESKTVMEMMTSWKREGLEQGREEGRREAVLDILEARFGRVPELVISDLSKTVDPEWLRELSRLAATVESLEDFCQRLRT